MWGSIWINLFELEITWDGITAVFHICLLIWGSISLYQQEKLYTECMSKNSAYSTFLMGVVILNCNFIILPLVVNNSNVMQLIGGFIMSIIILIYTICVCSDKKTLSNESFNWLNAWLYNNISILAIVLMYRERFRWAAFMLLLIVSLIVIVLLIGVKVTEKHDKKIIQISSTIGIIISVLLIIFMLFNGLFNIFLLFSDLYRDWIWDLFLKIRRLI